MMQIVPGSEKYYCRVEGCDEFTVANVPFGRCEMHELEHLGGAEQTDKLGFPPVGFRRSPGAFSDAVSAVDPHAEVPGKS